MRSVDNLIEQLLFASGECGGRRVFIAQRDPETWLPSPVPFADDPQLVVMGGQVIAICDTCDGERQRRERNGTREHIERVIRLRRDIHEHVERLVGSGQVESADAYIAGLIHADEVARRML